MKFLISLLATLTLVGCAAPKKEISEAERQQQAVQWAITEEVKLRLIAADCAQLDGILEAAANYAVRDWHLRNGSLIESADEHFTYHMSMFNEGNWAGATAMSQQMVYAAVQRAEQLAGEIIPADTDDKRALCLATLDQYKQGGYDLEKVDAIMAAQLSDLKSNRSIQQEKLRLQNAIMKEAPRTGRSLYLVEKLWAKRGCQRGAVKVLVSQWPDEIYQGSCNNESVVIACKWGNCRELK